MVFRLENGYWEWLQVRRVKDVLKEYDPSNRTEKNKITIINWLQKHPGKRFDITEIHQELKDDLQIGRTRTGQILKELENESVLTSHGDQRKAYELSEGIIIPVKYQTIAGLRHLCGVLDVKRWGVIGFLVVSTVLWTFLTLPFWFFSVILFVSPRDQLGSISQSEIMVLTIVMTIWLLVFVLLTSILQLARRWWTDMGASD